MNFVASNFPVHIISRLSLSSRNHADVEVNTEQVYYRPNKFSGNSHQVTLFTGSNKKMQIYILKLRMCILFKLMAIDLQTV